MILGSRLILSRERWGSCSDVVEGYELPYLELCYSSSFINLDVQDVVRGVWRLTLFYGLPHANQRRQSWELLRELVPQGGISVVHYW